LVAKDSIKVGVVGFGTVGTGTVKVLLRNAGILRERLGFPLELAYVADQDTRRDRGVRLPEGVLREDARVVLEDPEVDIVAELIGGTGAAGDVILEAIRRKKHVVTANKALLATRGNEIFAAARQHGVEVGFEASVAGGIPIIKVIREALVANNIVSVYGIINGTANLILTKMTEEGGEFSDALAEAQALGYAEADPTFDVEGVDAAHKLAILASLAYGIPLSYDEVYTEGITKITSLDVEFARELGYRVKLLAIGKTTDGEVEMRVHPTMVPKDHLIAKVDGVFNAVFVRGDAVGDTLYYGRGAGEMPTASAVVADIAEIAANIRRGALRPVFKESARPPRVRKIGDVQSMYYFRFKALDRPGVLSRISGIFGKNNISIASVIQKGRRVGEAVPLVILTHTAREKDIRRAVQEIDTLDVVADKSFYIRVEGEEE
jgi:homoserine dehydrogenase